ncbi:MAG: sigma-70 family RNA polymerase sigma factor [Acidobacteria bacterium]|nr:sigma-70 family RNA polymerase sigma factor [Acidobacteriota bacterium]
MSDSAETSPLRAVPERASNPPGSEPIPQGSPPCIPASPPDGKGGGRDERGGEVPGLIQRAQGGDRDAFGELYRLHQASVFRLARFHLSVPVAEDAVAETFLRAWKGLPRYRDTGAPFVSWLYGIARHVVADLVRERVRLEPRAELPDLAAPEPATDDRIVIAAALAKLPEEQRLVIELKFLAGLTNDEVGRALGKSPGAVNTQQWRALEALRREMSER